MEYFGQIPDSIDGFLFSGITCGIKSDASKKDLALILSEEEKTIVAGMFTKNAFAAGPVLVCKKVLKGKRAHARAIVANSGNANAGLGAQSLRDAARMQRMTAGALDFLPHAVLVSSTGKIGVPLPMEKIEAGIRAARSALSPRGFRDAAEAITTTDKSIKVGYITGSIRKKPYTIAAMAKGAGMISPNMATMLCYVVTDLAVERRFLERALKEAVDASFNATSVDGDMSTNDTVLVMANGRAQNAPISGSSGGNTFIRELSNLLTYLAREMVKDGEGATKCLEITVKGARSKPQAEQIARAIGNSSLVKCAFFGNDPNWGRILSAAGAADQSIKPDRVSLAIADTAVVKRGARSSYSEKDLARLLRSLSDVPIVLDLALGRAEAHFYASDLTTDYVHFNSAYTT